MDESASAGGGFTSPVAQSGFICTICSGIFSSAATLIQHERSHANTGHRSRANKRNRLSTTGPVSSTAAAPLAPEPRPTHDELGRALLGLEYERNLVCEVCDRGGTLIDCDYCNLAYHSRCADLSEAPSGFFFCPSCVDAERDGEEMGNHEGPGGAGEAPGLNPFAPVDQQDEPVMSEADIEIRCFADAVMGGDKPNG